MSKKRSIDKEKLTLDILSYLKRFGKTSAAVLSQVHNVSQSSVSRILSNPENGIVAIGKAQKTLYAAKRQVSTNLSSIPIYKIEENGKSILFGFLFALEPSGFYFQANIKGEKSFFSPDLPYFFNDLRPSGFIGNLIPSQNPDLLLPKDVRFWSAEQCLKYLCARSWNHIGNFILGDDAFKLYLENVATPDNAIDKKARAFEYARIANNILDSYDPGSSAGGDQPKFLTALMPQNEHVIVKFSPKADSDVSKRMSDLLICEYLAAKILKKMNQDSVDCELIFSDKRVFLEVKRFDRLPEHGRRGVISMGTLDAEFGGTLGTWTETALVLIKEKVITQDLLQQIRWRELFSDWIANTDTHLYNISFYTDGTKIVGLAPVYDMLPMLFMPRSGQIIARKFSPVLPKPTDSKIWRDVFCGAQLFWNEVIRHEMITIEFKKIAQDCLKELKRIEIAGNFLP